MSYSASVSDDDFQKIVLLGRGGQGRVYLARKWTGEDAGQLYAIKEIEKARLLSNEYRYREAQMERQALCVISGGPYLPSMAYAYQTETCLKFVLNYAHCGDVSAHLKRRLFTEDQVRVYMAEVVMALKFVHERGIISV